MDEVKFDAEINIFDQIMRKVNFFLHLGSYLLFHRINCFQVEASSTLHSTFILNDISKTKIKKSFTKLIKEHNEAYISFHFMLFIQGKVYNLPDRIVDESIAEEDETDSDSGLRKRKDLFFS